jgi:hypothetical protein
MWQSCTMGAQLQKYLVIISWAGIKKIMSEPIEISDLDPNFFLVKTIFLWVLSNKTGAISILCM